MGLFKRLAVEPLESRRMLAADLELVSVTLTNALGQFTGETPIIGEKVYAVAHWRTTDLSPGDTYNIRWEMDGVATSQFGFTGVAGTNVDMFWFHGGWTAPAAGSHVVTVTIDSDNDVAEANEANNADSSNPFVADSPAVSLPNKFVMPLSGVQNEDYVISGYVDVNPQGWLDNEFDHFEDFQGNTSTTRDFHNGIDIAIPNFAAQDAGVPVLAAAAGTVIAIHDGDFDRETQLTFEQPGNYVFISHGNGWVSQYYHFRRDTIAVQVGDVVTAGQTLGLVGSSGNSAGPHVHFEVQHNSSPIDLYAAPADYWVSPPPYVFDPLLDSGVFDFGVTNDIYDGDHTFGGPSFEHLREKISDVDAFVPGEWVYAYANFTSVRAGDTWKAQLYRPNGTLVNDFGPGVFPDDRPTEWSWYAPGAVENIPGTWRVDFLYNDVKVAERTFTVSAGGAPEMRVFDDLGGNNTYVIDGRQTPLDVGVAEFGDDGPTKTFIVENHGYAALTTSGISLPSWLTIVEGLSSSIAAGASDTFTVQLATTVAGRKSGEIAILSNDASESTFTFRVEGEVGAPHFFVATTAAHGAELWRSDGSTAGTVLVKNIATGAAGSYPRSLTLVDGTLYFVANNGTNGYELFKSDGSSAGTVLVKNIAAGAASSNPTQLFAVDDTLFFFADNGVHGRELWKSDGTAAGTVLVKNIAPGAAGSATELTNPYLSYMAEVDGDLYFVADNGTAGRELWTSDGTAAGTVQLKNIGAGSASSFPADLVRFGDSLLFTATNAAGFGLWKSDGTAAGTIRIKSIEAAPDAQGVYLTPVGGAVFFQGNTASSGAELWKTDGTAAGTVRVKDVNPGAASSLALDEQPPEFVDVGGTLFFRAANAAGGYELWKSDGTTAGTVRVKDVEPGAAGSDPANLVNVGGTLYFTATTTAKGAELWKSNGTTAGTVMVRDLVSGAGSSLPTNLTNLNGELVFSADNGVKGRELWISDGTFGGTAQVKDINPGAASSDPREITPSDFEPPFIITLLASSSSSSAALQAIDAVFAAGDFTQLLPGRSYRPPRRGRG